MKSPRTFAVIGGGPSGLMAAEQLSSAGHQVTIYDRMPSPGRKLLMAGRGGLNLTHSESLDQFLKRYGDAVDWLAPCIQAYPPDALRAWCEGLGQETFVGSSGRIFPRSMKAAPLLRAWLRRLESLGVQFAMRHRWEGWEGNAWRFTDADGNTVMATPDATLLALGGASWPRLGSDGGWVRILADHGISIHALRPANCGFTTDWSPYVSERYAGTPLKPVALTHQGITRQGEIMITATGIEGGAVYALSSSLREAILQHGLTQIELDLRPSMMLDALKQKLQSPRANQSLSTYLRKAGFSPLAVALLRESMSPDELTHASPALLASRLKALPLTLTGITGVERAISTAGGITRDAIDAHFMLTAKPGVFVAGEMLDWEAPTGGYLLQGCFSTAIAASKGMMAYCSR